MLKSYKQLSRWYGPLEPETGSATPAHADEVGVSTLGDDDGPARYPHYILDDDPDEVRARADVPTDLPSGRAEFTGGWSDWVSGRAPGPDDDYAPPSVAGVVRFPWPEDEFDDDREERATAAAEASRALRQEARDHPTSRRARAIVVLVVAVVLLGAAAAGVLLLLRSSSDRGAAEPTPSSMHFAIGTAQPNEVGAGPNYATRPQPGTGAGAADACPTEREERIVRSAESGGTTSGPDAVLSFQYGYYVERSGERAREVVAPEAAVSPASVIQRGIDSIPVGTTHCVRVVTITESRYLVEITEYRPGGVPATYNKQTVTTAVVDGRTLITGIAAG
ncbi:hypothetical protein ACLMAJ_27300 [Nocardia sp. KC 131]|uniref:hypothetical protein n=1 Tax=Nocardia arseniciresistens TaxID=3392119 RepID=UPI00398EB4EE